MYQFDIVTGGLAGIRVQVHLLASDETAKTDCGRQVGDDVEANTVGDTGALRHAAKGVVHQGDRRQDGGVFPEDPVIGRPTAPQARVVHHRQVIQRQRGGMHHLDGAGGIECNLRIGVQIVDGQQSKQRPGTLAR